MHTSLIDLKKEHDKLEAFMAKYGTCGNSAVDAAILKIEMLQAAFDNFAKCLYQIKHIATNMTPIQDPTAD